MAQEFEAAHSEDTFVWADCHSELSQSAGQLPEMVCVFLEIGAGDQYVIQIHIAEIQAACHLIHKSLERLCCIS